MNQEELEKLAPGDLLVFKSGNSYPYVHHLYRSHILLGTNERDRFNKEFIFIFVSFSDDLLTLFSSEYGVCQRKKRFSGLSFMAFLSYINVVS